MLRFCVYMYTPTETIFNYTHLKRSEQTALLFTIATTTFPSPTERSRHAIDADSPTNAEDSTP